MIVNRQQKDKFLNDCIKSKLGDSYVGLGIMMINKWREIWKKM